MTDFDTHNGEKLEIGLGPHNRDLDAAQPEREQLAGLPVALGRSIRHRFQSRAASAGETLLNLATGHGWDGYASIPPRLPDAPMPMMHLDQVFVRPPANDTPSSIVE